MATTATVDDRNISDMGKKRSADRHKTARVNVGFPEPWHAVARKLAAKTKQPVLFLLIALLEKEAKEQGVDDLPTTPWDEEAEAEGG